ncbi:6272_t:CDS:2, partial [Dentiscutata erythropus]
SINANNDSLFIAKENAYNEVEKHGGLLKYWSGEFNQNQECLSMYIWASRDNAFEVSKKPLHTIAKKLATESNYEFYALEKYILKKEKNETKMKIIQITSI